MWIAEIPESQILFNTTRYHYPDTACNDEYCHSITVSNVTRNFEGRYFCYIRGDRVSIIESPIVEPAVIILTLSIGMKYNKQWEYNFSAIFLIAIMYI